MRRSSSGSTPSTARKTLDDPYYNPNLTRDREDFSESDDLRRLKEGRVTVRFRGGTLQ